MVVAVEEERPRGEIDNRRAGDAHWVNDSGAREIILRQRHAKIALPNDAPIHSVKRVYIIRFGYRNDHWAACAALDVKRLRVNVAYDRAVRSSGRASDYAAADSVNAESI